jgi:hypothetical protein
MGQPSMRITVNTAMRVRDVSRTRPEGEQPPPPPPKPRKGERRRLGKRGIR